MYDMLRIVMGIVLVGVMGGMIGVVRGLECLGSCCLVVRVCSFVWRMRIRF